METNTNNESETNVPKTPETDDGIPENAFLIIEGVKVHPLKESVINIGRRLENHVVIDDPRISRNHAQLRAIKGRFVLFDLNSSGGTYVNGQRIGQGLLYPGDLISLAGVNLVFMQGTHLPGRSGVDGNTMVGPGQRPTAVFNTSIFTKKKRGGP